MRKEPMMKDRNKGKSEVTYKRLGGDSRFKRHHALQEHALAIRIFLRKLKNRTHHTAQRGVQVQEGMNKELISLLFTKQLSTGVTHGRLNTKWG